jgi:large subunit ribosomal protein L3
MVTGFWGKKIGMTQVFKGDKVVPVTAINTSNWLITQIKNEEKDGYHAIQVGCLKTKYQEKSFEEKWLTDPSRYFSNIHEIKVKVPSQDLAVGKTAELLSIVSEGNFVDVLGTTIGRGFAGTVKRHNFKGGSGGHGDKTGRRTGSVSFMRSRGRVIKGKRLPGHMGVSRKTVKNLEVVKIDPETRLILVKGSVPGKTGSLVYVTKCE